jgi:hypothetical protein
MKNIFLFLTALMFSSAQVRAQKIFSEGIIQYDVFINNNANPEGIYVITVKNGYIKRELAMNNGFNNVTIYNQKTGKTLSLNVKDDTKYALEITADELKEKNKRFQNAVFTPIDKTKKLAGYQCEGSTVVYENRDEVQVYYTSDLVTQNETFNNQFPGLKGIPLEYETKSSPTNVLKFVATLIEVKVIDSKTFTIPENYKIVTKEELSRLK